MIAPPDKEQYAEMVDFLYIIQPWIEHGYKQLHEGFTHLKNSYGEIPFLSERIIPVLKSNLSSQLLGMMNRTMILELHVARLQNKLAGETSQARFQSFIHYMRQEETQQALWQEYPLLAEQIQQCIAQWAGANLAFLQDLCEDIPAIQATFYCNRVVGSVTNLILNAGDRHKHGRTVIIAQFDSGLKLVYKPRSLAIDAHFQNLLSWLNKHHLSLPFREVRILDCQDHGWTEFIEATACSTIEEVKRFYKRQGALLALLYALEAADCHYENLIAAGEYPVLIDLESLFHPYVEDKQKTIDSAVRLSLAQSVLRVGLLPQRLWQNAKSEGIEVSGLCGEANQMSPYSVVRWQNIATDDMHVTRQRISLPEQQNRPRWGTKIMEAADYQEQIIEGFTALYQLLIAHREALVSTTGPLAPFLKDQIRFIPRDSYIYSLLLYESFHPDALREAHERNLLFDKLQLQVEITPYLAQLVSYEKEELSQGDIPYFAAHINSPHLWRNGKVCILNFLEKTPWEYARQRLEQLSESDLSKQIWFIEASLATITTVNERTNKRHYRLEKGCAIVDPQSFLSAAQTIGDRLETLAIQNNGEVSWLGLTLVRDKQWSFLPVGIELYSGLPGIALFLAYLSAISRESRYQQLAELSLNALRRQLQLQIDVGNIPIGGFAGLGGVIYLLCHLSHLWNRPTLLSEAIDLVPQLTEAIKDDDRFDIIGGAAGAIGGLLTLYHCTKANEVLAAARNCGDWLVTHAQSLDNGIGWPTVTHEKALSGFSHGAAGIAWALIKLAAASGEERFTLAGQQALIYERSLFSADQCNWPDLRITKEDTDTSGFMTAWCHGAPGIGLGRLELLDHLDDALLTKEIEYAVQTTLSQGWGKNHSLCHGDLGNLDFLLQASIVLKDPSLQQAVYQLAAAVLQSIEAYGRFCGVPAHVETPGLMVGLAGIGYELLRLALPEQIPSILTLSPPARRG